MLFFYILMEDNAFLMRKIGNSTHMQSVCQLNIIIRQQQNKLITTYYNENQNQNQKELYCQVCLHTQGMRFGGRSFQYRSTNIVQTCI